MKKRLLAVILLSTILVGCGKGTVENRDDYKASEEEKELAKELKSELTDEDKELMAEIDAALNEETEAQDSSGVMMVQDATSAEELPTDFDPLPEIINSDFSEGKIQVGPDMIFTLYNMTFADVEEMVKNSNEAERYEWEEHDPFMGNYNKMNFVLHRDGKSWVIFQIRKPAGDGRSQDDFIKVEDGILMGIEAVKAYDGSDNYVYYAKGIKSSGGGEINFENIDSLFNGYEEDQRANYLEPYPDTWTKGNGIYNLTVSSKYAVRDATSQVGNIYPLMYKYTLKLDGGTGELKEATYTIGASQALSYPFNTLNEMGLNEEDFTIIDVFGEYGEF